MFRFELNDGAAWIDINERVTVGTLRRARSSSGEDHFALSLEIVASQIVSVGGDWSEVGPQFDPRLGGAAPDLPPAFGPDPLPARRALVDALPLDAALKLIEVVDGQSGLKGSEEKNSGGRSG